MVTNCLTLSMQDSHYPVFVLITQLKDENPDKYRDIVPFLGPIHTQCVMMSAIYKRYKGSELGEILVVGGVITEGSVDRAPQGLQAL